MKIATMATGGIGGFLAVRLAKVGHQVATIARGDHLQAIKNDGLTLEVSGETHRVEPWIATSNPDEVGEVDVIIFGVKGDALETAAELCLPMIGPGTIVIPFLNGVEASARLSKIIPPENVGNGLAQVSTTISAPGVISQTGEFNRFIFAEQDSRPSARIDALRKAIDEAGSSAPPTDDIERDLWSKFVLFSAVSGVTTAARCTCLHEKSSLEANLDNIPDTVYFLTDGSPTRGEITSAPELLGWFENLNRFAKVRLHVVAFGNLGVDLDFLGKLAKVGGGEFIHVPER